MTQIEQIVRLRQGTTAEWELHNPVLAAGEAAANRETGEIRVGDGVNPYLDLPVGSGGTGIPTFHRSLTTDPLPDPGDTGYIVFTDLPMPAFQTESVWPVYQQWWMDPVNILDDILYPNGEEKKFSRGEGSVQDLELDTETDYFNLGAESNHLGLKIGDTTGKAFLEVAAVPYAEDEYAPYSAAASVSIQIPDTLVDGDLLVGVLGFRASWDNSFYPMRAIELSVLDGMASVRFMSVDSELDFYSVAESPRTIQPGQKVRIEVLSRADTKQSIINGVTQISLYDYGSGTSWWSAKHTTEDYPTSEMAFQFGKLSDGANPFPGLFFAEVLYSSDPAEWATPLFGYDFYQEKMLPLGEGALYYNPWNGQNLGFIGYLAPDGSETTFDDYRERWNYFPDDDSGNNSSLTDFYRVYAPMVSNTDDSLTLGITQRSVNNVVQYSWNGLAYEVQTKLEMSFESPTDPGSNFRALYVNLDEIESVDLHWWGRGPEGGTNHLPPMSVADPFLGMHGSHGLGMGNRYFYGHMPVTVVARVEEYDPMAESGYGDAYFDVDRSFTAIVSWSIGEMGVPDGWIDNALTLRIVHPTDAMVDINNSDGDQAKDRVTYHATIEYSYVEAPAMLG